MMRILSIIMALAAIGLSPIVAALKNNEPISPLPQLVHVNTAKAELGKKLFFDPRLSKDNTISCASCHDLAQKYGADGRSLSAGSHGKITQRNTPTVFNSQFNSTQLWDGRSQDLYSQALLIVVNPNVMGISSWSEVVKKLSQIEEYKSAFMAAYGKGISAEYIAEAIAEFEKTLVTANSPFDKYLRGNEDAITERQKRGYQLFKSYGCVSCHQGKNVGGNLFQKLGVLKDISLEMGSLADDLGRFNITRSEWDKRVFRVPSLRLAAKTAPYFHNGSVATLEEAVDVMIKFQLGRKVPLQDKADIVQFIESLVGELPAGVEQ